MTAATCNEYSRVAQVSDGVRLLVVQTGRRATFGDFFNYNRASSLVRLILPLLRRQPSKDQTSKPVKEYLFRRMRRTNKGYDNSRLYEPIRLLPVTKPPYGIWSVFEVTGKALTFPCTELHIDIARILARSFDTYREHCLSPPLGMSGHDERIT